MWASGVDLRFYWSIKPRDFPFRSLQAILASFKPEKKVKRYRKVIGYVIYLLSVVLFEDCSLSTLALHHTAQTAALKRVVDRFVLSSLLKQSLQEL